MLNLNRDLDKSCRLKLMDFTESIYCLVTYMDTSLFVQSINRAGLNLDQKFLYDLSPPSEQSIPTLTKLIYKTLNKNLL